MGVHLIDNMQLARLAAACAERGRWEFLLTLAPLLLERGTASPVNPIAMFSCSRSKSQRSDGGVVAELQ